MALPHGNATVPHDDATGDVTVPTANCYFPGCSRPSRPDAATGRPAKYCEEVVEGVRHNRVNAWHRRRADKAAPAGTDSAVSPAPVSMARATLEQLLVAIPEALTQFAELLNGVVGELRTAGDLEAAGAEVEDARREALAQVSEADRRVSAADRARRDAEARAEAADTRRAEADAVAEAVIAEKDRIRTESEQQLALVRKEASAAIGAAEQQVHAAREEMLSARDHATAAQAARDAAQQAAERDRAATVEARAEARADRHELQTQHAEQLRQLTQATDARAAALSSALDIVRDTADTYRAQLAGPGPQ